MKKLRVNFVGILFAVLSLVFTACNSMLAGGETGTVRVVIGGGASARSINPSNGLPVFDDTNTKITVTDEDGNQLAQGTTSVTLKVGINRKITVEATITTPIGIWRGSVEHTVTAGTNTVAVKLSKAPKGFANLLFSITGGGVHSSGGNIVSLSTQNGKKLLDGIFIGTKPRTARDKIGRIYVLYEEPSVHIKRFDVEGNEDTGFETNLTAALPFGVTIGDIDNIAIHQDDNYIFLFKKNTVYCFKEKEDHSFESFESDVFPSLPVPVPSSSAVAVYDDVMLAVYNNNNNTLFACKFEFEDASGHSGAKRLKFESQASRNPLNKLRTDSVFGNNLTECTGLFADKSGVYCLLKEQGLHHGKLYALGQLVHYTYSGSTLTKKGETGLNPAASTADPIAFNAQYFSNPVGFIGYDEENIYIADDGVNIGYINENWHIKGNKNRIAAFNRKTKTLTFSDTGATWYDEKPKYPSSTKTLLWEKQSPTMALSPMNYWISTDGTEAFSGTNKLFEYNSSPIEKPTDVFCYDQDGNLYILWKGSSGYNVRRFALKEDGSYDTQGVDASLAAPDVSAIAVDISDGQNILYYAYKDGPNKHIQRYSWHDTSFSTATQDPAYDVHINSTSNKIFFTALAANKDGVFVGVKETYQHDGIDKYRLKIKKYKKSSASFDGELTLVDNAPEYTDSSDNPIDYGHFSGNIRIQYGEAINNLKVFDGVLYALSSKSRETQNKDDFPYFTDAFKNSGILYKIGSTNGTLPENAVVLAKKDWNDTNKIGYGFYRFIAVKYDEAERIKLIIASDGAWDENGIAASKQSPKPPVNNTDKILEYDLAGSLRSERNSGGSFSKTLKLGSGFEWY